MKKLVPWTVWTLVAACAPASQKSDDTGTSLGGETDPGGSTGGAVTSGTGTGGGSGDATDGGSTGAPFIVPFDGGQGSFECDPWAQDCAAGEKCMPWANDGGGAWNATKCTPVDPNPKQPGDSCTVEGNGVSGVDDCDTAAMCWGVDPETNMGTCVAFCKGDELNPICDNPAASCVVANEGALILCLPGCDPLLQDCESGDVCISNTTGDGFVCVLDASGEGGFAGEACEYANVCDPGLFCANATSVPNCEGSVGCCAPFCEVDGAEPCPADLVAGGAECVPWYEEGMAPPGQESVGACVIPA